MARRLDECQIERKMGVGGIILVQAMEDLSLPYEDFIEWEIDGKRYNIAR